METPGAGGPLAAVRLDKWLWAARFFKTRAQAQQAVAAGHVRVNDERVKPAKDIRCGDRLAIRVGPYEWEIAVRALSARRGPAAEAQQLYLESDESRARRAERAAQLRAQDSSGAALPGRPTKRDRRVLDRFTRGD